MQPHRRQSTRFRHSWDSPGKNTGVGCHFLLQCMKVKVESEVTQSCPTLATPWTAAYQARPSMGFSKQEYWSGVPLPSPYCLSEGNKIPCAVSKRHSKSWIRPRILDYIKAAFLSSAAASLTNRLCVNTSFQLAHDWGQGEHRSLKFKNNPSKLFFAICCVKIPCPNCLK